MRKKLGLDDCDHHIHHCWFGLPWTRNPLYSFHVVKYLIQGNTLRNLISEDLGEAEIKRFQAAIHSLNEAIWDEQLRLRQGISTGVMVLKSQMTEINGKR